MSKNHHSKGGGRARLEKHYGALLSQQESSGLSMATFAAQAGVSSATLYSWRRRLRSARDRPELVEVSPMAPMATDGALTLRVGEEYSIEVPAEFDGETLKRVLEVLSAC